MATATLSSVPTPIDNAESVTNWGGDTFSTNSSDHIQGNSCVECVQTVNGNNDVYVTGSWDFSGTGVGDQHLRLWFLLTYVGNLSATNPIQVFLYDGTNTAYYYWDKGSTYTGGWEQAVIYTGDSPDSGSVNKANITRIGMRMVTSTKPRNATWNALYDAWTYGDGYTIHGGSSGDALDWSHIAATDATSAYGIVREVNGVYFLRGALQIGDGTNTTYFEPSGQVAVFTDEQVLSTLYDIKFVDSVSGVTNVDIAGGAWAAVVERYTIDASDTDLNAFTINGLQISGAGTIDFQAGASITNVSFSDCYQIDPSTCTFENNTVANYSEAAVNGALLWPGGTTVTDCSFINCDEAIEITQTTSQTFDGLLFSGNTDDVHLNNGGNDINVSKNNGSNPTSQVSTGGGTVTFVGASVTLAVTTAEGDGTAVGSCTVLVRASDGTGPFPFEETVTITNSGTTATVSHTAHGMATGDKVIIRGASHLANNGVFTITVTGVNAYTYTMGSSPGSNPTGTINSTFVALYGTSNASTGIISASRVFPTDQPVVGKARKSSGSPYWKTAPITGTVSSTSGFSATAVMQPDE